MAKMKIIKLLIYAVIFLLTASLSHAAEEESKSGKKVKWVKSKTGIKSLMTFAKDREAMIREYEGETSNYDKIKNAIDKEHLEVGEEAKDIAKKYGDPIVIIPESGGDIERWVYKPGNDSFFKGEKIYLFFDQSQRLMDWDQIDKK